MLSFIVKASLPLLVFAAAAIASVAAAAQSTNARPVIVLHGPQADPAAVPLLNDEARKTLMQGIEGLKVGSVAAQIVAAGTDGKNWAAQSVTKKDFVSSEDLARQTLETCEYWYQAPCYIVTINGRDARDASGGLPVQPRMLTKERGEFDFHRVPFVSAQDRILMQPYANATTPRALIVTTLGGWLWRNGDTVVQAIATAASECAKIYPNQVCILYAVNDRVVFAR